MANRETGDEVVEMSPANQRAIPRAELARLRRGELDPNVVAELAARTVGLTSPAAPLEGDLVPSASGWLIGTGEPRRQLYPDFYRRADRWFLGACFGMNAAGIAGWLTHPLFVLPVVGVTVLALLACITIVPRARLRRQFKHAERVVRLGDVPQGTVVRVAGTIARQATVPTLFRGVPAVLFRNRIGNADETRGQDFVLDLDEGEQAKVAVRRAFLLEPPRRTREPPACGPVSAHNVGDRYALQSDLFERPSLRSWRGRYESSVGPGDRVEICGVVNHVLDPAMERRSPRQPPMRPVLVAGEETPLLVRRA
jgi:hypothetical protein